jgi:hypothetical protein
MNLYAPIEKITTETYVELMRYHRDRLLAASDWAMTSDAPTDKQAWTDYRQQLRDFPATWTPGPVADFPDPPA